MVSKRALILQPPYLPWVGMLAMVDCCDVFVVYDDVQFEHQSWQHRNRIRNQNGWMWLTVPIVRKEGQLINEVMIDNTKHWQKDHWRSIEQNYGNAPYFKWFMPDFELIYQREWNRLVDLNVALIYRIASQLGIKMPKIMKSSDIEASGNKTDRLIPILKAVGADSFIEGMAGKAYLDVKKINDAGIEVLWFDYQHPTYPQKGEFISHLSTLDLLFNVGDKAIDYIRQGVNLVEAK